LWKRVLEASCGSELWKRVVEASCGSEFWKRVVEASSGSEIPEASSRSEFWKRVLERVSEFLKRVLKASSQSEFSKRVLEASSRSEFWYEYASSGTSKRVHAVYHLVDERGRSQFLNYGQKSGKQHTGRRYKNPLWLMRSKSMMRTVQCNLSFPVLW
jgi:hypothetical protein